MSMQAIVDDILQELGQTPKQLVAELEFDLVKLINKHSFMGVSACAPSMSCSHPVPDSGGLCPQCGKRV